MSLGNGFASFVNGFVGGRDTRDRWEDRKDSKERQKVLDEYEAERQKRLGDMHGWAGEQHQWAGQTHRSQMTDAQQRQRLADLGWEDTQATRAALAEADAAAFGGMGGGMGATPPPANQPGPIQTAAISTQGSPPTQGGTPQLGYGAAAEGIPRPAMPLRDPATQPQYSHGTAAPVVAPQRAAQEGMGAAPEAEADPLLVENPDGTFTPLRGPRDATEQMALAEAAKAGRLKQGDASADRQAQVDAAGMSRATENPVARALRLDEGNELGGDGMATRNVAQAGKHLNRTAVKAYDAVGNQAVRGGETIAAGVNAISRWMTGEDAVSAPERFDTLNRNAPAFPDAPATVPKDADEGQAAAATGAESALEAATSTPAGAAAIEAMPSLGVKPGQPMTPAQIDRAAQTHMQSYRDNGLPIITRELMRQGKFAEAETLRTFVNDAAAQDGMKAWSGAVFAALSGDVDTAAARMIDAYNSSGYFDDGFEIVKDKTDLIRDDDGTVMGLRLTRRNQSTGEETTEEGTIGDVIERGLWLLSPEQAAQQYMAQQQAIAVRLAEMDAERRELGGDIIKEQAKQADANALKLIELTADSLGQPTMTLEEARAAIAGQGAPEEGSAEDDVPMLRRPER
ncbi:hypothetical protein [Paracoccus hibiscisoli]|uniref:Uncharacterized protein n=1 Tax=Paracoccus hibiscisoli TaxID=2023261 RepID=A0A4U0QUM5_9RHOB|nr:hypothetical protein [Paracoccus hibiscisoli]TJZ85839.1 hypothetical protein FA740_05410 [Paracoccus hibiscisoli]